MTDGIYLDITDLGGDQVYMDFISVYSLRNPGAWWNVRVTPVGAPDRMLLVNEAGLLRLAWYSDFLRLRIEAGTVQLYTGGTINKEYKREYEAQCEPGTIVLADPDESGQRIAFRQGRLAELPIVKAQPYSETEVMQARELLRRRAATKAFDEAMGKF